MVLLVIAATVHVRLSLVSLDDHHSLKNAGMVANESMQCSHAPPKLSTLTCKTSNCGGFATVVKFATVAKHLEKAGVVANEST